MLWVLSKQSNNFWSASPPVPWDEGDVGTKVVSLHEREKLLKVHKTVRPLQHRIINDQTGVDFRNIPTCLREGPFDVKDKRHCGQEVIPHVKILRLQFRVYIDNFSRCKKKDRHAFVFELPEYRAILSRDNVDQIPLGRA